MSGLLERLRLQPWGLPLAANGSISMVWQIRSTKLDRSPKKKKKKKKSQCAGRYTDNDSREHCYRFLGDISNTESNGTTPTISISMSVIINALNTCKDCVLALWAQAPQRDHREPLNRPLEPHWAEQTARTFNSLLTYLRLPVTRSLYSEAAGHCATQSRTPSEKSVDPAFNKAGMPSGLIQR